MEVTTQPSLKKHLNIFFKDKKNRRVAFSAVAVIFVLVLLGFGIGKATTSVPGNESRTKDAKGEGAISTVTKSAGITNGNGTTDIFTESNNATINNSEDPAVSATGSNTDSAAADSTGPLTGYTENTDSNNANPKTANGDSKPSTGTGGANGDTATPPLNQKWHEPWSKWVVDTPAWTETIIQPSVWGVVDRQEHVYCNTCGAILDGTDIGAHLKSTQHTGYHTGWEDIYGWIDTPPGYIHHPEEGHWEFHEGYWS